jgi:hypothetical protein
LAPRERAIAATAAYPVRGRIPGKFTSALSAGLCWQDLLGREGELRRFRLVQGLFRYNLRELLADDARMLVILRDPLRRTVSALRHLQRDPGFHHDHQLAKDPTLSEVLRHPELMQKLHNVEARLLMGVPVRPISSTLRTVGDGMRPTPTPGCSDRGVFCPSRLLPANNDCAGRSCNARSKAAVVG